MKLNNKGFAITGILYTVLILFLLLLSSLLLMLTTRINRLIKLTDSINKEVENNNVIDISEYSSDSNENKMSNPIDGTKYFITSYRGKYEFNINDDDSKTCYSYLPENTLLSISNGVLKYKLPSINENGDYAVDTSSLNDLTNLIIFNCQNQNVTKVKFDKVYSSTNAEVKEKFPSSIVATEYIESLLPSNLETMNNDDPDGNVRYMGADPNNYVSFNNELWRIIGVFDVASTNGGNTEKRLKIIRYESIGSYSWDNKPSGTGSSTSSYGSNDWTDSAVMEVLNNDAYWNRTSGTCPSGSNGATTSCDFSGTGLTEESKSLIGDAVWNLGGTASYTSFSNGLASHFYGYERGTTVYSGRPTYWIGKIGLMYLSDYGYATSGGTTTNRASCLAKEMYNWSSSSYSDCKNNNYLYNSSLYQWTITPRSSGSYGVFRVNMTGSVGYDDALYYSTYRSISPVLYLKSTVQITGGEGTSENPYTLE